MPLKKRLLKSSLLYLVLDKDVCQENNLKKILKEAISGGVDIVQFRDKLSTTRDAVRCSVELLKMCRKAHIPFIINDRLDVALSINADGLHLGQDDMPVAKARIILGGKKIIGLSCHSTGDIQSAKNERCDYMGFGPIFKTLTKPKVQPLGINAFKKALSISNKPIFAIGGINENNIKMFPKNQSLRIAVIREICLSDKPAQTAIKLKEMIRHVQ